MYCSDYEDSSDWVGLSETEVWIYCVAASVEM